MAETFDRDKIKMANGTNLTCDTTIKSLSCAGILSLYQVADIE